MLHGPVDIPCVTHSTFLVANFDPLWFRILKAGDSKAVNTFIVCPSVIYGIGGGLGSKTSSFYKYFISSILDKRHGYVIGEGTNIIGMVGVHLDFKTSFTYQIPLLQIHIKDLTALNLLIFDVALATNGKPLLNSAFERFYIATAYDNPRQNIMRILTNILYKQGFVQSSDLKHLNFEEDPEYNLCVYRFIISHG